MTNAKEIVLNHLRANPGNVVHAKTLKITNIDYMEAYESLKAEGKIEWRKVPSKSGKRMISALFATD